MSANHSEPSLASVLQGKADAAYCDYLRLLSDAPCLGVEHKLQTGKFTTANLEAHCVARQHLGAHKAFTEAINLMSAKPGPTEVDTSLERDAARYRWHERNHLRGSYIDYYEHGEQLVGYFVVDVRGGIFHYGEERYQTLDEAIDAAIAAGIGAA